MDKNIGVNICINFNGTENDKCKAKVNYREICDPGNFGTYWVEKIPCIITNETNIKCEFLEIKDEMLAFDQADESYIKVGEAVQK